MKKSKKIKAIFRGANLSCGYETNKEYTLVIRHSSFANISIKQPNGDGKCEYSSAISFLDNWDNVRNTK
jgi:hypothetical protein